MEDTVLEPVNWGEIYIPIKMVFDWLMNYLFFMTHGYGNF